ncbi:MAG TPA: hypothetical protein VMV22_05655 [Acidimicrobiales bacterium]|nr:hypothetical protein [Acidimicrobiales bacterium]
MAVVDVVPELRVPATDDVDADDVDAGDADTVEAPAVAVPPDTTVAGLGVALGVLLAVAAPDPVDPVADRVGVPAADVPGTADAGALVPWILGARASPTTAAAPVARSAIDRDVHRAPAMARRRRVVSVGSASSRGLMRAM